MNRLIHERETDQIGNYAALETNKLRGTLQVARSKQKRELEQSATFLSPFKFDEFYARTVYIWWSDIPKREYIYMGTPIIYS